MNMTTTALCDFASDASENDFPSTVVSWKSGAAAPIAGDSAVRAEAAAHRRARTSRTRNGRMRNPPAGAERGGGRLLFQWNEVTGAGPRDLSRTCLNRERGSRHHGIELPDVLVRTAEELDRDRVVRLDRDGRARARHGDGLLRDRNLELLRPPENFVQDLLLALDRSERGLLLHRVVERRRLDLDRNDFVEDVPDRGEHDQPEQATNLARAANPASSCRSRAHGDCRNITSGRPVPTFLIAREGKFFPSGSS